MTGFPGAEQPTRKPGGPKQRRYSWAALVELNTTGSLSAFAREMDVDYREMRRWIDGDVPERWADHVAVKLGRHPSEIWGDWTDVGAQPAATTTGICEGCGTTFEYVAHRKRRQYCTTQCYRRAYSRKRRANLTPEQHADYLRRMADYRAAAKKAQAIYNRRWYERMKSEDPDYWKRYYEANAERRRAQQREYYWRKKSQSSGTAAA